MTGEQHRNEGRSLTVKGKNETGTCRIKSFAQKGGAVFVIIC